MFITEADLKKYNYKLITESCFITYKGEIILVYINSKTDKAVKIASKHLEKLGNR